MTSRFVLCLAVLSLMPIVDTLLILGRPHGAVKTQVVERSSLFILWFCVASGLAAAWAVRSAVECPVLLPRPLLVALAVTAMLGGMCLRWAAMITLGRFFTPHVALASDQELVVSGPYRFIRHPAYAGILLVFAGVGLAFENWLSMAALFALTLAGVLNRVRVEEAALELRFGASYSDFAKRTKRFVPFVV